MQRPAHEISAVVSLITTAVTPEIQQAGIQRYFTPDAGFRHPLCAVSPGPGSRERVLGIYQWYRVMSPKLEPEVKSVVYDKEQGILILEVVQSFHFRLSPFKPAPSRLVVRLTLKEVDRLYYIAFEEDFYHPDVKKILPFAEMTDVSYRNPIRTSCCSLFRLWLPWCDWHWALQVLCRACVPPLPMCLAYQACTRSAQADPQLTIQRRIGKVILVCTTPGRTGRAID
ncbi:hypothetical protein ARMGADRAFT_368641 [Armillaria gallica]|uniref:SigF-like NTF2-like domain-containing protein n=1 Tax=Armillaria gallica TaxID=47427 RepID=A0A2H3EGI8_ARMGA|nr:hypothetical protein ARMGADRAFT_368641 [Armillaria gallica]